MKITTAVVFAVVATALLTFFALAAVMGPLLPLDSRSLFVLSVGGAGVVFAALAFRRFLAVNRALRPIEPIAS